MLVVAIAWKDCPRQKAIGSSLRPDQQIHTSSENSMCRAVEQGSNRSCLIYLCGVAFGLRAAYSRRAPESRCEEHTWTMCRGPIILTSRVCPSLIAIDCQEALRRTATADSS